MGKRKSTTEEIKNEGEFYCEDDKLFESTNTQMQGHIPARRQFIKQWLEYAKDPDQSLFKKDNTKQSITNEKVIYRLQILSLLVLMTLCILLISNYDNLLQLEALRNQKIISSYDDSLEGSMELRYKYCPDSSNTFHVNCNEKEQNIESLSLQLIKQTAFCRIPILGNSHLHEFINRWNTKFPNQQIKMQNIHNRDKRQQLLSLLKLYFSGGIYLNKSISYSEIDQRSWKYSLTGFEIVFIDYLYKNDKGIYVPNYNKFMKTRFPYSPQIKHMIERFLNEKDIMEECEKRQCLIIKSNN